MSRFFQNQRFIKVIVASVLVLNVFLSPITARAGSMNSTALASAAMAGFGAYYAGNSSMKCFMGGSSAPQTPMFCSQSCGPGPALVSCAMGVLYAGGALVMADAAIKALRTADASKGSSGGQPTSFEIPTDPTNPTPGGGSGGGSRGVTATDLVNLKSKILASMKAADAAGIHVNPDGSVTMKNGAHISAGAVGTAGGLKSMGLSDAQAEKILADQQASAKDMSKMFSKVADLNGFDGAGGGHGKTNANNNVNTKNSFPDFNKLMQSLNQQGARAPAAAVPQKLFNGEAIGVASSNIFATVSQRYSAEQQAGSFISSTAVSPSGSRSALGAGSGGSALGGN